MFSKDTLEMYNPLRCQRPQALWAEINQSDTDLLCFSKFPSSLMDTNLDSWV